MSEKPNTTEARANYLQSLANQIQAIDPRNLRRDRYGWPDYANNEPQLTPVQQFHRLTDEQQMEVEKLLFPEEIPGQETLYPSPQALLQRIELGLIIGPETGGSLALPPDWIAAGQNGEASVTIDQSSDMVTFTAVLPGEKQEFDQSLDLSATQGLRLAMSQGHQAFWQFMQANFPQWRWPVGSPPSA